MATVGYVVIVTFTAFAATVDIITTGICGALLLHHNYREGAGFERIPSDRIRAQQRKKAVQEEVEEKKKMARV